MAGKTIVTVIVASEIAPIWKVSMEFPPDLAFRMDRPQYEAVVKAASAELRKQIKKVVDTEKVGV